MEDYKKILINGLQKSNCDEKDYILRYFIKSELYPAMKEFEDKLKLKLQDYKLHVVYDYNHGGIPQQYIHQFWVKFPDDYDITSDVAPMVTKIIEILCTGDEGISIKGQGFGLLITLTA